MLLKSASTILVFSAWMMGCGSSSQETLKAKAQPVIEPLSASHQRAPEFQSVTAAYGPLIVREGEFEAASVVRPWSSWWFPIKEPLLFEPIDSNPAPLQKYDKYTSKAYQRTTRAADFEREHFYDPQALGWEGLCDAWAIASLLEPEPTRSITIQDIQFSIMDLKALLIKTYEKVEGTKHFGQRFNGTSESVFDDIYPDQFHRLMQVELFEKKRPFIMDKDPGIAVWNTPVWKAIVRLSIDSTDPHVMHAITWLDGASPFVDRYDFIGTQRVVFEYTYDLFGQLNSDGTFKVNYGDWTGRSKDYHPDFLTTLPEGEVIHASRNQEIDPAIVAEILKKTSR